MGDFTDLQKLIKEEKILLIQFGSLRCTPCEAIRRKINEWLKTQEAVRYVYLSVEDFSELAAQEGIFTVPTIQVYVAGKLTIRESGYFSLEDVLRSVERYSQLMK